MQLNEMKRLIEAARKNYGQLPYRHWQFTTLTNWEWNLLTEIGAIKEDGIVADYPMIEIDRGNGDTERLDYGGNLNQIQLALREFDKQKKKEKARIVFVARKYTLFREALEAIAKEKNANDLAIKNLVDSALEF